VKGHVEPEQLTAIVRGATRDCTTATTCVSDLPVPGVAFPVPCNSREAGDTPARRAGVVREPDEDLPLGQLENNAVCKATQCIADSFRARTHKSGSLSAAR
jgi:hypothetical protein